MPERLAYDEAMQLSPIRLKIQDPELKQGKVEMVSVQTAMGSIERPWGIEGGFAVVYKFRRKNGTVCALRCFRVPMSPDTQFRYGRIGPYFHTHACDITAGFKYYDEAIIVKELGRPQDQKYPVIEMDWIDGVTLVDKINELCGKRHRAALKDLAEQWISILRIMERAHIAHGDLAGVNVMVRADDKLVLIDYDGVYIPEFANLSQVLLGQDDFQHPQMAQRKFNEHMDAFSALVIYTALIALASKPELWNTYTKFGPNGNLLDTNILFRRQDFQNPQQSPLFRELEQVSDTHVKTMVRELKRACLQPIDKVKFPFALIDPHYNEKQALAKLERAMQAQDDEQIVACWLPLLDRYPPAQQHRSRVQLAQQRVSALKSFRTALATGNLENILHNYDPTQLDASKSIIHEERQLLSLARAFLQAYRNDNDDAPDIADRLQNTIKGTRIVFTARQQQRLLQMRQRKNAQQTMQMAFVSKDIEKVAAIYPLLQYIKGPTPDERERIEQAVNFMQVYTGSDDNAFLAAYDTLQQGPYRNFFIFTQAQEHRATLIRRHNEAIERFRIALTGRSPWRLVKAYDPMLDNSTQLTATEREQLALARLLVEALRSGDDAQLLAADSALQHSPQRAFFLLTSEEKQRFAFAHQKRAALLSFRRALQSKKPREIIAAYDPILDDSKDFTQEEREQLTSARLFVNAFDTDDDEALIITDEALQRMATRNSFIITEQEQQRFALAKQRIQALNVFRQALLATPTDAQRILDAYDASLLDASTTVTNEQREIVAAAQRYLAMCEAVRTGIRADSDDLIRKEYDPELAQRFTGIAPNEQQRIDKAMLTQELEDLLNNREYERSLLMAHSIQKTTGQPISDTLTFKLKRATMRFIREHDLSDLSIEIEERADTNYAMVSWRWPATPLIQTALLVWQTETWPDRPSEKSWRDPEWRAIWVRRKNNVLHSSETFPIGKGTHIYVRGYAAILDTWEQEKIWRFSDGNEPTSYAEAASPQMIWRIQ